MDTQSTTYTGYMKNMEQLRLHDLVAKTAGVSYKSTLRVLIALKAVAIELDLSADEILSSPYTRERPTALQAIACNQAYLRMHETGRMHKYLYEVEQVI